MDIIDPEFVERIIAVVMVLVICVMLVGIWFALDSLFHPICQRCGHNLQVFLDIDHGPTCAAHGVIKSEGT